MTEPPIEPPPAGAPCAEHRDRPAVVTCPQCRRPACLGCWHPPIRRCQACLTRDPSAAAPPMPWEDTERSWPARFFGTLGTALTPLRTAPAFARPGTGPAWLFAALTFVPLALLSAIVPMTHTLGFGPRFATTVIGDADAADVALDVALAGLLGLLESTLLLGALALPYVSLTRAYGESGHPSTPVRAVLYRGFLLPLGKVLLSLVMWSSSAPPTSGTLFLAALVEVVPLVLLFSTLRASARMGSGVGPLTSLVVSLVPLLAIIAVGSWVEEGMRRIRPELPAEMLEAPADAAGAT